MSVSEVKPMSLLTIVGKAKACKTNPVGVVNVKCAGLQRNAMSQIVIGGVFRVIGRIRIHDAKGFDLEHLAKTAPVLKEVQLSFLLQVICA